MKNVTITPVRIEDVDTLFRWGEENWELWGDEKNKWFSKASLKKWIQHPGDDVLLVARDNGRLIGMCMMSVLHDWAFCTGFFVEKDYREQGLGKRLLAQATRKLKAKEVQSIILLVDIKNESGIRFYEREKFYKGFQLFMMTKEL